MIVGTKLFHNYIPFLISSLVQLVMQQVIQPNQIQFAAVSFNRTDKIRLIDFPAQMRDVARKVSRKF